MRVNGMEIGRSGKIFEHKCAENVSVCIHVFCIAVRTYIQFRNPITTLRLMNPAAKMICEFANYKDKTNRIHAQVKMLRSLLV